MNEDMESDDAMAALMRFRKAGFAIKSMVGMGLSAAKKNKETIPIQPKRRNDFVASELAPNEGLTRFKAAGKAVLAMNRAATLGKSLSVKTTNLGDSDSTSVNDGMEVGSPLDDKGDRHGILSPVNDEEVGDGWHTAGESAVGISGFEEVFGILDVIKNDGKEVNNFEKRAEMAKKRMLKANDQESMLSSVRLNDPAFTPTLLSADKLALACDGRLHDALSSNTVLLNLSLKNGDLNEFNSKALWDALVTNTTLRSLDLSHNAIADNGAKRIVQLLAEPVQLQTCLTTWEMRIRDTEVADRNQFHAKQHLQSLLEDSKRQMQEDHDRMVASSGKPSNLKWKERSGFMVRDTPQMKDARQAVQLAQLNLLRAQGQEAEAKHKVSELGFNTTITELKIRSNGISEAMGNLLADMLCRNEYLKTFDCAGNVLGHSFGTGLLRLHSTNQTLTHLDISGCGCGLSAAEASKDMLENPFPPLRFLNIGGNSIGNIGAQIVSDGLIGGAASKVVMLKFLGLDNNSMGKKGIEIIFSTLQKKQVSKTPLVFLDLQYNCVSGPDIQVLQRQYKLDGISSEWNMGVKDSRSGGFALCRRQGGSPPTLRFLHQTWQQIVLEQSQEMVDRPTSAQAPTQKSRLKSKSVRFEDEAVADTLEDRDRQAFTSSSQSHQQGSLKVSRKNFKIASATDFTEEVLEKKHVYKGPESKSGTRQKEMFKGGRARASGSADERHIISGSLSDQHKKAQASEENEENSPSRRLSRFESVMEGADEEVQQAIELQWGGLARAADEVVDPVEPLKTVDHTRFTNPTYDPEQAFPHIVRKDKLRIALAILSDMRSRVSLSPTHQGMLQTVVVNLGIRRIFAAAGFSGKDLWVSGVNNSAQLNKFLSTAFPAVDKLHPNAVDIEMPPTDAGKLDQGMSWLFACAT